MIFFLDIPSYTCLQNESVKICSCDVLYCKHLQSRANVQFAAHKKHVISKCSTFISWLRLAFNCFI